MAADKGNFLPFERGVIWNANTAFTGAINGLPGTSWNSVDFDRPINKRHGFGIDEVLVVLRNGTASAIDRSDGGKFFKLSSASSQSWGRVGGAAIRGGAGYPLDDSYSTASGIIPSGCDAYFVKKGLSVVRCHTTPGTIQAYISKIRVATNGHAALYTSGGNPHIVGIAANTTATGGASLLVLVGYDVPLP